jgi:hypothetical protein
MELPRSIGRQFENALPCPGDQLSEQGKPRNATLRCLTRNGGLSADQRLCRRRSGCPSPCRSSDRPAAISFGSAEHTHQNKAVKRAVSASRRSYLTRQTGEENSSLTGAPPVRPPHETEGDPAPFKAPARTGMICSGLSDPKGREKGGRTLTGVADTSNAPANASAPQKRVLQTVNARVLRRHDSRRDGNLPNWANKAIPALGARGATGSSAPRSWELLFREVAKSGLKLGKERPDRRFKSCPPDFSKPTCPPHGNHA